MATSGSTNFTATRAQIIQNAFYAANILRTGQAVPGDYVTQADFLLNGMIKHWQATGIHVWTVANAVLIPTESQIVYDLGSTSTDHACLESDYIETALSADAASGASSIDVDSIVDISNGDQIGIKLDDGTIQWTTINGAPSGSTITLTDTLTDSASEDAKVFTYTTALVRPLKIVMVRRKNLSSGNFTPMSMLERLDYQSLSSPDAQGLPVSWFYDPQLTLGKLHIYQRETNITEILYLTVHRPIEDMDAASDNPDLPQEWIKAIYLGLCLELAIPFDIPEQRYKRIVAAYSDIMGTLSDGFDREEGSVFVHPDVR